MSHILDRFTHTAPFPPEKYPNGTLFPRTFGQSLFREIPLTRDCSNGGVPNEYCACAVPRKLDVNDTLLVTAAEASVKYINTFLAAHHQCVPLRLSRVTSGAVKTLNAAGSVISVYVVSFTTEPGQFLFESNVKNNSGAQVGSDIVRMNKISKAESSCIKNPSLEGFCYCSNSVL